MQSNENNQKTKKKVRKMLFFYFQIRNLKKERLYIDRGLNKKYQAEMMIVKFELKNYFI